MKSCLGLFLLVPFLCTPQISARQYHAPTFPDDGKIHLDVVVTPKSGPPVSGLQQQDFTVFDNKVPQTIFSFQALREREAPIEVLLVVDDVNTGLEHIAFERSEIDKFLRTDGGQLAHPIALAFLTDAGIMVQDDFSSDGNAISAFWISTPSGYIVFSAPAAPIAPSSAFRFPSIPYLNLRPASLPARDARSFSGFLQVGRCSRAPASRNSWTQSNSSRSSTRSSLCQLCCGRAASLSTVSIL
jgi:hypothetical protein